MADDEAKWISRENKLKEKAELEEKEDLSSVADKNTASERDSLILGFRNLC